MKLLLLNNPGGGGGGGGGTPGGSTTQVQFNDGGAFAGDADLTWNSTTNVLGVTGDVNLSDGGTYTTTLQTITPTADRTISLPDATGTVALVAGSSGQVLWNNAGVNAGASTLTYDGSILTTSGKFVNSYNASSTTPGPAKWFTGTWFTSGGSATTTKPQVLIEPTGATSTAWSTSGTGLGVNAASGFAGRLLDLQVNGTSLFSVNSVGVASCSSNLYVGTSNGVYANGRAGFVSPADSIFRLINWNADNFDRLQFGGGTTSFPALKRSSAILQVRLADDSGYTTIDAQHRLQGTAPATASSTGTAGDVRYDTDYVYICTATNTWKRAALTTW
jgi:hypothetical protein